MRPPPPLRSQKSDFSLSSSLLSFALDSEEKKKKGRQCIIILLADGINVCGTYALSVP